MCSCTSDAISWCRGYKDRTYLPAVKVRSAQYSEASCLPSFFTTRSSSTKSFELIQGKSGQRSVTRISKIIREAITRRVMLCRSCSSQPYQSRPYPRASSQSCFLACPEQAASRVAFRSGTKVQSRGPRTHLAEIVKIFKVHIRSEGISNDGNILSVEIRGGREPGQGLVYRQPPLRRSQESGGPLLRGRQQELLASSVGPTENNTNTFILVW